MSLGMLKRMWREWAAMLAVLAVALGPLAIAVNKGLGAAEQVSVASGMKPLALCLPGGGDPAKPGDHPDCDHCMPVQPFALATASAVDFSGIAASRAEALPRAPHASAFPRAPPARGPPLA